MSPRRNNLKSHHGCFKCKRSSVKCDERRPRCSRCLRRQLECQYASLGQWKRQDPNCTEQPNNRGSPPVELLAPIFSSPQSSTGEPEFRISELSLLLQWTTSTYRTVSRNRNLDQIWQEVMPKIALSYPFLLHGILCLAALHLVASTPELSDEKGMIALAEHHQSRAIRLLHASLTDRVASNCDAVFSSSLVLTIVSFGFPLVGKSESIPVMLDEIHRVLMFTKTMMNFTAEMYESVQAGQLSQLAILNKADCRPYGPSLTALSALHKFNKKANCANRAQYEVFRTTIQCLEAPLASLKHDDGLSAGFMWIFRTPDIFFDLYLQRNPSALVILSHFCVLLHQHRSIWWISSWGYRIFDFIYRSLDRHHRTLLAWPIVEIGYTEREN